MARLPKPSAAGTVNDAELVARIGRRDQAAFEILMRRYNSKLFRVARAIVKDDAEAEDALQDTYLEAYRRIGSFRGESQLVTWLTRIVINQALMRLRRQKRDRVVVPFSGGRGASPGTPTRSPKWLMPASSRPRTRRCEPRCGGCWSGESTSYQWRFARFSSCARSRI